ncbi:hypothetical protein [Actinophytocola algeriensis]|uniref:Uncharacterized protein n=1 Tax=Actinophytocola algeriensis TaxID=1768010 RepID=A0A7W7VGM3_9PSEU|nr:hypothetical protein [Actinophytocola algeriensis]MBB4909582.1 hypothetical protein [Actinophytocola algeriensis]MBE1475572.1 hypothetical protein [Actinophytocola algeriensis]
MTDFTVSPPDLTGFSDQIGGIGEFYSSVGGQAAELSLGLSTLPVPMGTNGQLSGVLALFLDDFVALVGAERDAATRLAGGLGDTGQALAEVAHAYREQDDAAKRRIEEAGASEEDQAVDDAIEEGEPNVDWRSRLSGDDVFSGIGFEPPKMTYEGQFGELNALAPPALSSDAAGGTTPGEPEGLTEEQADPEGPTEEPNEPAGLTEEPNDAEPVEAGGQQSR